MAKNGPFEKMASRRPYIQGPKWPKMAKSGFPSQNGHFRADHTPNLPIGLVSQNRHLAKIGSFGSGGLRTWPDLAFTALFSGSGRSSRNRRISPKSAFSPIFKPKSPYRNLGIAKNGHFRPGPDQDQPDLAINALFWAAGRRSRNRQFCQKTAFSARRALVGPF